ALSIGANFFDHADVYGRGDCEAIFSKAVHMTPAVRETMILQSKCGIRPGVAFDFSKKHILESVDGSLKRLGTDYLDVLLLHRPDALAEPEEIAQAFDGLQASGKVRHFGVSNQSPMQIQLLKRSVKQPLVANQLQLSITNATMITRGMHVNMLDQDAVDRDGGILDFCRLHDITVQPWSPFQYGFFEGVFLGSDKYPELNKEIDSLAEAYGVSNTTIVIAWLLRHPAHMQPVTGTMNVQRLKDCVAAADVRLTREEWYVLLLKAGNTLP
ncbi:MAG: aldo/keto reductase, partial [Firmicutes bacterium]|nr:aldo/keto reductase [Bacillota bacterium]